MSSKRCRRLSWKPSGSQGALLMHTERFPNGLSVSISWMGRNNLFSEGAQLKSDTGFSGRSAASSHLVAVALPPAVLTRAVAVPVIGERDRWSQRRECQRQRGKELRGRHSLPPLVLDHRRAGERTATSSAFGVRGDGRAVDDPRLGGRSDPDVTARYLFRSCSGNVWLPAREDPGVCGPHPRIRRPCRGALGPR